MNYKKILLILLIMAIGMGTIGCINKGGSKKLGSKEEDLEIIGSDKHDFEITDDEGMRKTVLYFKDQQGLLIPLMQKLPWEPGIAKSAIENMVDSPGLREAVADTGLYPIIPAGTKILGMSINEESGICKVDFSSDILNYDTEQEEEGLIKGIVYTLTEFKAIDQVEFLVDGEVKTTLKHGTDISDPIKRENINLIGELDELESKIVVYYKKTNSEDEFEYFVPVTVPTLAPIPNIHTALEILFNEEPEELGLSSDIPIGTEFYGVDIKDGIAYIDISFYQDDPLSGEAILMDMMKSIGLTLGEFDEIEKVELLIDGKTIEEAGMDSYTDLTIPAFANEY